MIATSVYRLVSDSILGPSGKKHSRNVELHFLDRDIADPIVRFWWPMCLQRVPID